MLCNLTPAELLLPPAGAIAEGEPTLQGQQTQQTMVEIRIRSLTGRIIPVEIGLEQRVSDLKEVVEVKEGIPPQQQRFLFAGRQLDDEKTLAECGVAAGSDLHLVLSLRGGTGARARFML